MANLDYDVLHDMDPINVTGPLYCCPEANPRTWTHQGDAFGAVVQVPLMAVSICGRPGRRRTPRRRGIENGYRRGGWPGGANVVHLRQGTTIDRCSVSASTAA